MTNNVYGAIFRHLITNYYLLKTFIEMLFPYWSLIKQLDYRILSSVFVVGIFM